MNRVRIVHFDSLTEESIGRIFDLERAKIARRYRRFHGLALTVTPAARKAVKARSRAAGVDERGSSTRTSSR